MYKNLLFLIYKFLEEFEVNFPSMIHLIIDKINNFHQTIPQLKETAPGSLIYLVYYPLHISSIYIIYIILYVRHLIMRLCIRKSKHQVIDNSKDEGTTMATRVFATFSDNST